jgi:murein DD-endopeptidase MepM/ murein hydrolase activator NlpD
VVVIARRLLSGLPHANVIQMPQQRPRDAGDVVRPGRIGAALRPLAVCLCVSAPPAAAGTHSAPVVLQPPVASACISSPFGWRRALGPGSPAGLHNGVDIPAPAGAIVHAAAAGTIVAVRRRGPGGFFVSVRHADGRTTLYAHLGMLVPKIAMGARNVAAGEPLGRVGRSGITYGPHVFFAVFEGGKAVDPEPLLALPRCGAGR